MFDNLQCEDFFCQREYAIDAMFDEWYRSMDEMEDEDEKSVD